MNKNKRFKEGEDNMKKAIAILLVVLVAGVMFGATVNLTGSTTTGTTDLVINAVQGSKTDFTLTQSTTIGTTANKIDLDATSVEDFNTPSGVKVADWKLFSTHRAGLTLSWTVDGGGFTSVVGSETITIPYEISVAGESFASTTGLATTGGTAGTYSSFVRTGNGAYKDNTEGNFKDIKVRRADDSTEYVAGDYVSTIKLTITAN